MLGKHTDYAGGRSLLCAVDRGFTVTAAPRSDSLVRVGDLARGETREYPLDPNLDVARADWGNYVATVVRRVARDFPGARRGADIGFESNLPAASGMSSSSALVVAIFLALDAVNDIRATGHGGILQPAEAVAAYLASVEMGSPFAGFAADAGVGTLGGSEDHTAILCCREGFLSRYSFVPTRAEGEVPFSRGWAFVVAFCGVAAEKTGPALASYNEASLATRRILELWNRSAGRSDATLASALESDAAAGERIRRLFDAAGERRLRDRFDQFVLESTEIVPRATDALRAGDVGVFGDLVHTSQLAAEQLLGNQIPATSRLVRLAREAGAVAASAFGAGFGGSVWAMVATADAETFIREWRDRYAREFPELAERAEFFVTRPGRGAYSI